MGGDIHLCSMILGKNHLILLYFANLFGSTLSFLATIITIVFYLVKKHIQNKSFRENPHQFCHQHQYFDSSKLNEINNSGVGSYSSTPISIQNNNNNNNNNNAQQAKQKNNEKQPLINKNHNNNNYCNYSTSATSTSSSSSSFSSTNSGSSYEYQQPHKNQQTLSSSSSSDKNNNTIPSTNTKYEIELSIPQFNGNKCGPNCLLFSNIPHIKNALEQKKNPKKIDTLIFYLSISDFIAVAGIIIEQLIIIFNKEISKSIGFCIGERVSIHFGLLATLFWSNCIAYYLLREAYELKPYNIKFIYFHIVCWGMALIGVASLFFSKIITVSNIDQGGSWCSVSSSYQLYFWVIPLFISFTWNLICYCLIYRKFNKIIGIYGIKSVQIKTIIIRKLSFYLLAFLITWVWDVINNSIFLYEGKCPPFALWILQEFFSSGYGFFNSLAYAVTTRFYSRK
ncbi:hypothetical protein ACTFIR_001988 [Dictyostelium discoideum]